MLHQLVVGEYPASHIRSVIALVPELVLCRDLIVATEPLTIGAAVIVESEWAGWTGTIAGVAAWSIPGPWNGSYPSRVQAEDQALPTRRPARKPEATRRRRAAKNLTRAIDLLHALTESDLRFRYGRGPWRFVRWLLEPVALVGVYLLLVTFVLNRHGTAVGLSLTCAVVPFQLVMLTAGNAMSALEARRPVLLNMAFDRMLLPVSSALTESAGFAASLLLLAVMMAIYRVAPTWNVLWFPLVLVVNLLLAVALAYPAALFGVWLRELKAFGLSFVRILFFLGPGLVPLQETSHGIRNVLRLNPLTGLFQAYRDVFMNGHRPAAWELLYPLVIALILVVSFVPVYRSEQRQFAKVL